MEDADLIVVMGSNMAENHPVAFRWVTRAQAKGAKLIHIDPRFTRTSAMADLYAPIRSGTDVAVLGGLMRYMIENNKYFRDYVVNYTNAATIVSDEFRDTEDLDGVFSGLNPAADPNAPQKAIYNNSTWQYKRQPVGQGPRAGDTSGTGQTAVGSGQAQQAGSPQPQTPPPGPPFDPLIQSLVPPTPPERDETLQNPRTVFQILRRHYSRYTPEMVERITGMPQATFLQIAETVAANSGPDKTTTFVYAMGWTQKSYGPQTIGAGAMLQQLLGNMGRPGGGVMALRGHANVQGATDIPTLYHSIHGYMNAPSALKAHDTLTDYLKTETLPTCYWANEPKFMVSYLKSMYGDAATKDNDFGYTWHPKVTGDHSDLPMFLNMADGKVKGMFAIGQNPATSINAGVKRKGLSQLEWLVVKENFETETAAFWYRSPEVLSGQWKSEDIKTEVFLFPSAQVAEGEGSFTNTQRLIQWHEKAADPPGDARTDIWFTHQLALRLRKLYANSTDPRDAGFKALTWDFDFDPGTYPTDTRIQGEPDAKKILLEINGYEIATKKPLSGFALLKDDGSTTAASWIYTGVLDGDGNNRANSRKTDPENKPGTNLGWGWAWPANRRILYNRASARPDGQPWSEAKKYVWWDPQGGADKNGSWVGYDVPDFALTKAPNAQAKPGAIGLDALSGTDPFIMKPDGRGWLFAPSGMADGPFPTHYEPLESPIPNLLYKQQSSPVAIYWDRPDNKLAAVGDPNYPIVMTTYRLTEHHLAGGMTRWLPWLAELQPELFIEMSPELAKEKGINNLDFVKVTTLRGQVKAKALVTPRLRPLQVNGKTLHLIGAPWHFGYMGLAVGDVINNLTPMTGDPNVTIHEAKAFLANLERA
jgi:formate dehydrogenase major subunit